MSPPSSGSKNKTSKKPAWKQVASRSSATLKIDAACSSETSVDFQRTTWCYILEDRILQHKYDTGLKHKRLNLINIHYRKQTFQVQVVDPNETGIWRVLFSVWRTFNYKCSGVTAMGDHIPHWDFDRPGWLRLVLDSENWGSMFLSHLGVHTCPNPEHHSLNSLWSWCHGTFCTNEWIRIAVLCVRPSVILNYNASLLCLVALCSLTKGYRLILIFVLVGNIFTFSNSVGTMLQAGRPRVLFPMRSLDFSIDLILYQVILRYIKNCSHIEISEYCKIPTFAWNKKHEILTIHYNNFFDM
jgi:hypothetical protein